VNSRKWIIAHRGDHSRAAENSIEAFHDAIAAGADMIEFDVRRLSGGSLIVSHDPPPEGMRVPLFSEVLQLCAGRILLDIELKDFTCEDEVLGALSAARLNAGEYILTSFDAAQLRRIREKHPSVRTGLLTEALSMQALDLAGSTYLAPESSTLSPAALDDLKNSGIQLLPWTVNATADLERLLMAPAVAGVITDCVQEALAIRRGVA